MNHLRVIINWTLCLVLLLGGTGCGGKSCPRFNLVMRPLPNATCKPDAVVQPLVLASDGRRGLTLDMLVICNDATKANTMVDVLSGLGVGTYEHMIRLTRTDGTVIDLCDVTTGSDYFGSGIRGVFPLSTPGYVDYDKVRSPSVMIKNGDSMCIIVRARFCTSKQLDDQEIVTIEYLQRFADLVPGLDAIESTDSLPLQVVRD